MEGVENQARQDFPFAVDHASMAVAKSLGRFLVLLQVLRLIGNERGSPHIWGVKYNEKAKAKANPT
jgi:hypothetical protein